MTTTTTTTTKSSARNRASSLFGWTNRSRQVTPLNCFLEMDGASPRKPTSLGVLAATELMQFDEENAQHGLSYTSLRDLLPTSPMKRSASPQGCVSPGGDENPEDMGCSDRPPIKNRLVEQAARAYLLPTSPQKTPPDQFFARYWAKLTSAGEHSENVWTTTAPSHQGCVHGCTHGCLSCLPSLIWVDLTRVVHALFGQLRRQSLLRDHAQGSAAGSTMIMTTSSLMTPSLVK